MGVEEANSEGGVAGGVVAVFIPVPHLKLFEYLLSVVSAFTFPPAPSLFNSVPFSSSASSLSSIASVASLVLSLYPRPWRVCACSHRSS